MKHSSLRSRREEDKSTVAGGGDGIGNADGRNTPSSSSTVKNSTRQRPNITKRESSPAASSSTQSTPSQDPRHWQNRVGKRYRDKLSTEFVTLQAALAAGSGLCSSPPNDDTPAAADTADASEAEPQQQPVPSRGQRGHTYTSRGSRQGQGRCLNKARVLDAARERVTQLLEERRVLMAERDELLSEKTLKAW
jgi:hypothetical protein